MKFDFLSQAAKFLQERKEYRRWLTVFMCLALVVTFGTVTALKMYGQAMTHQVKILDCQYEVHEHVKECYEKNEDGEKVLVCDLADYVIHVHNDDCYDKDGNLSCLLKEHELHEHEDDCWEEQEVLVCNKEEVIVAKNSESTAAISELACVKEEHKHNDSCYTDKQGCAEEEHTHNGSCYTTTETLNCTDEEHDHDDSCYEVTETLTCTVAEHTHDDSCAAVHELTCTIEEHEHDDRCYQKPEKKVNAQSAEEGHTHTDSCYRTEEVLACGEHELHIHDDSCYDKDCFDKKGNLIEGSRVSCELLQLEEHIHTEECFRIVELTNDEVDGLNRGQMESVQEYKEGTLKVILTYNAQAGIPKDAELKVDLVTKETDEDLYQKLIDVAQKQTEIEGNYAGVLCNISLVADEEEIELQDAVNIEFQISADGFEEESFVKTVYLGEDTKEELESTDLTENEDGSLSTSFDSESLGQFALLIENNGLPEGVYQKEFSQEYEDCILKVIATYGEDAQIPEEAELIVEAVTEEVDEDTYREKTDAARELTGYSQASAELLYNIGFYVDGEEIEPKGTVTMEFQMYRDGIEAGEPVTVIHFGEDEPKVLESTDMSRNEDGSLSTSFDSDSFSPFMLIVGGEEVRLTGLISRDGQVYEQADPESNVYELSEYEPALEEPLQIEVLETVTDAQGEEWYRYAAVTEDEALSEILSGYPYVMAKDVVLEGTYTRQTLTATDDEGVKITVEGLLPEDAKLTANRIYDPVIADINRTMSYNTDGEADFGDFRLVYDMDLGKDQKLLEPVSVTISNFDFSYDNYSNLSAWGYSISSDQENVRSMIASAEKEEDADTESDEEEMTAAPVDAEVEKIDAKMEEGGTITFETERLSILYIASTLIEGHDEYFNSLAEPDDILQWEDIKDLLEEEDETEVTEESTQITTTTRKRAAASRAAVPTTSAGQIVSTGGSTNSNPASDGVTVSKTIGATDVENVFDITLKVTAPEETFNEVIDPDVAIVLVVDVSNTMNYGFKTNTAPGTGDTARKAVAITAGRKLINEFYTDFGKYGNSRIGMVTFNTSARATFGLQTCKDTTKRDELKDKLKAGINDIVNASGYASANTRFTNIEAGLKRARVMLEGVNNKNKYIILVTDGFPTTYINKSASGDYTGYVPITTGTYSKSTSDGIFQDRVNGKNCIYGCNYSDKGAKRAATEAATIKNAGVTIYSVGLALGQQSVKGFINDCKNSSFATVDITSSTYAVGTTAASYQSWLKSTIGSGYYYDGATADGFTNAMDNIMKKIVKYHTKTAQVVMTVADPVPSDLEFIGFYNNCNSTAASVLQAQTKNLSGSHVSKGENTATISSSNISWNLQKSGFTSSTSGSKTTYTYTLKYRVRLKNEAGSFVEGKTYNTNGTTTLTYKTSTTTKVDSKETTTDSANKTINFKIPSVNGYLSELEFKKIDLKEEIVPGAEFTLTHDTANCKICRGNSTSVPSTLLKPFTATSDANGKVSFTKVPSGHQYILKETKVPEGYYSFGETYQVKVAYDTKTITKINSDKSTEPVDSLDWTVENGNVYNLPETGGSGVSDYAQAGTVLALLAVVFYLGYSRRKGMRGDE